MLRRTVRAGRFFGRRVLWTGVVEPVTVVVVLLLLVAVAGSVLPLVPSGLTALAGVAVYVLFGPSQDVDGLEIVFLAGLVLVGLLTALVEHFGGALASRAGGAEWGTMLLAGAASLVLFLFLGPLGVVVGVLAVVLLAELSAGKSPREAAVASAWTVAGLLGSAVAQFLLTLSMLVGFLAYVFVLG